MFGIKLWSRFAVFRDPLTITQNLTFPIPPKTTIGGMLAAVLGIEYKDYFADETYFNFGYSLVLQKPIRKRSFAQNYVADYTHKSETRHNAMKEFAIATSRYAKLVNERNQLESKKLLNDKEKKKLNNIEGKISDQKNKLTAKQKAAFEKNKAGFVEPKPIYREILLSPEYLIFIKNFKYEEKAITFLQNHYSEFQLYMGNSEFAANYTFIECTGKPDELKILDSFTAHPDQVMFEAGKKYTNIFAATKTTGDREYRDYRNLVFSDSKLNLNDPVNGLIVTTGSEEYCCEFI